MAQTIDINKGFSFHKINMAQTEPDEIKAILTFIGYFHKNPLFLDGTKDAERFKTLSQFFVNSLNYYMEKLVQGPLEQGPMAFDTYTSEQPEGKMLILILDTLTNITGIEHYDSMFLADEEFMECMGKIWFNSPKLPLILPSSFGSMINLTHTLINAETFYQRFPNALEDLLNGMFRIPVSAGASGYFNGYFDVLCNLSRIPKVRDAIMEGKEQSIFAKLILYLNEGMSLPTGSKKPLVSTIKHCLNSTDCHEWLLGEGVNILPILLLPLMGGEEFTDEEYESMPIELQYLEKTKEREPVSEIRTNLLFCLLQLSRTPHGRNVLRQVNVIVVMRELMKFEQDTGVGDSEAPNVTIIQNIVEVLVKEEKEIGTNPDEPFVIPMLDD